MCPNWDTWEYLKEFVMQCLFSKKSERYWVAQQRTRCLLVPECPEVLWSGRGWRTYGRVCYVSLHIKSPPSHNNTLVLPCYNNPVILWCVEWLPHYCTIKNYDFTVMVYVQKMFAGSEIQLEPYIYIYIWSSGWREQRRNDMMHRNDRPRGNQRKRERLILSVLYTLLININFYAKMKNP